jgi:hypothetical protein
MKFSLENYSGDVNIYSGPTCFFHPFAPGMNIHITPESLFTSSRNDYSHAPESAPDIRKLTAARRRDAGAWPDRHPDLQPV